MSELSNLRVAVLATDGFEESELTEPVNALKQARAKVEVVSTKSGQIQAFRHHDKSIMVDVDQTIDTVQPNSYDAVLLPGGALNADTLRLEPKVKSFLKQNELPRCKQTGYQNQKRVSCSSRCNLRYSLP